jgi:hypothetical protein
MGIFLDALLPLIDLSLGLTLCLEAGTEVARPAQVLDLLNRRLTFGAGQTGGLAVHQPPVSTPLVVQISLRVPAAQIDHLRQCFP